MLSLHLCVTSSFPIFLHLCASWQFRSIQVSFFPSRPKRRVPLWTPSFSPLSFQIPVRNQANAFLLECTTYPSVRPPTLISQLAYINNKLLPQMSAKAACLCFSTSDFDQFLLLPRGLWQITPNFNVSSRLCQYRYEYITDTISLCTTLYYSNLKSYMFWLCEIAAVRLRVSKIYKKGNFTFPKPAA